MRGSRIIDNPFLKIIEIQDKMFQVKRVLPINRVKIINFIILIKLLKVRIKKNSLTSIMLIIHT